MMQTTRGWLAQLQMLNTLPDTHPYKKKHRLYANNRNNLLQTKCLSIVEQMALGKPASYAQR